MVLQLLNYFYFDEIEYFGTEGYTESVEMKFGDFLLSDYCDRDSEYYDPNALASVLQRGSAALVNLLYATFIPAAADYNPDRVYVEGEFAASFEQAPEMENPVPEAIAKAMEGENAATEPTGTTSAQETTETTAAETETSAESTAETTEAGTTDTEEPAEETETTAQTTETAASAETEAETETAAVTEEEEEQEFRFGDSEITLKCDRDNYGNWAERIGKTGLAEACAEGDIDSEMEDVFDAPARLVKKAVQEFASGYLEASAKLAEEGIEGMIPEDAGKRGLADIAHDVAQRSFSGDLSQDNHALYYIQAYDILDQYEYHDGMTVAEYLVDIGSVAYLDSPDELYPFYPLAAALTNAQTYLMQINGVAPLAMYLTNASSITRNAKELYRAIEQSIEGHGRGDGTVSVWEGIDRDKYKEKFAETNSTIFKNSTGQLLTAYTGTRDSFRSLTWLENTISYVQFASTMLGVVSAAMSVVSSVGVAAGVWTSTVSASACRAFATAGGVGHFLLGGLGTVIMGLSEVSIYMTVAILVIQLGIQLYRTHIYSEDYVDSAFKSEIPGTILDTNDANEYVYYYPAKGSGSSGAYRSFSGKYGYGYGDLNGGAGRDDRWSALCWTKAENAGSPLRLNSDGTCFLVQKDTNVTPSGYEAVSCFNEKQPANLNANVDDSDAPPVFLFYVTEDSADASLTNRNGSMNTDAQYVTEMTLKSGENSDAVAEALRADGWQPVSVDLTPNLDDCVTLLGYKSSTAVTSAITDLRILPKGADAAAVTKQHQLVGETRNGDRIYTTADLNRGDPILADMIVVRDPSEAPAGTQMR